MEQTSNYEKQSEDWRKRFLTMDQEDICRRLPASSCIPVRLNFWDADDEFPAQANLLFDSSATDFNHVESIVTIATEALYQLAEAAELTLKGCPFFRF